MKFQHGKLRNESDSTLRLKAQSKEPKLTWRESLPTLALIALIALIVLIAFLLLAR
jgi:hypothetical protein